MPDEHYSTSSLDGLDAWVQVTWPRAVVFARSLLFRRDVAEDVVQDCYVSLLRKAGDYDLTNDGVRLLMTTVRHACLKKNTRERRTVSLTDIEPNEDVSTSEPHRVMEHSELEKAIGDALAGLPELQRSGVELKGQGLHLQDIAAILDVTPTNAGVLIHRGRQALQQRLAPLLERKTG